MDTTTQLDVIDDFLSGLGFHLVRECLKYPSYTPGIRVSGMTLTVDSAKLLSPGDIFHDAGHVATVPSLFRDKVYGNLETCLGPEIKAYTDTHEFIDWQTYEEDQVSRGLLQCSEAEAIAWSYAAAVASGLPPESVFHPKAYDGEGERVQTMLSLGCHYGVNGLQAAKMTTRKMYPKMLLWLQK